MALKLIVSNIYKSYNDKFVLKDCSFCFDHSGVYVLTGPNGSGKSTFLRICALLENPDSGKINYFDGDRALANDLNLRRRITLLLPDVGVFNTTVFNNVAYGLKIRGLKKKQIKEKVHEALQFVGLLHKKDQNALTLSRCLSDHMNLLYYSLLSFLVFKEFFIIHLPYKILYITYRLNNILDKQFVIYGHR